MSMNLGGRVLFDGKLDVHVATRRLSRRDIIQISAEEKASTVPLVVLQVDNLDVIENYYLKGRWVKPSRSVGIVEGIRLIASHLCLDLTISKTVVDCILLGMGGGVA